MKKIFFLLILLSFAGVSCKKELSCEGCMESNKQPIAVAGPDQVITLPTDSVSLDGTASSDPGGTISEWLWQKISGPASFNVNSATAAKTVVKNLIVGVYKFELKVTDNGGLFAKDTVQIIVNDPAQPNRPPVANAGPDQTITLPVNITTLDGIASTDPENNITSYAWTKILGPASFNITNANAVQTQVTNLEQGTYQFELKVTDAGGLFSKDTVQITVNIANTACDNSNRPLVNAQLIPIGTLSQSRPFIAVASAGNKICFAGGSLWPFPPYASSRVDIYDIVSQTWSTAELSVPRWQIATVAAGNKIFFAGGGYYDDGDNAYSLSTVDIYDVSTNNWSVASLSESRFDIAAATVGNKVFFAGGIKDDNIYSGISNTVDIYDLVTNSWSTKPLSEARGRMSAVTANNKIYFAGGMSGYDITNPNQTGYIASNKIDIYDNVANSWSTSSLSEPRYYMAGISVADKIYWAGGLKTNPGNVGYQYHSCTVEIKDVNSQSSSFAYLFKPRNFFIDGGQNAVVKDNKIVFFTGSRYFSSSSDNKFDIYDITTNTWSIGVLPVSIEGASIISVNNTIYVVLSNQVWKLEF